MCLATRTVLPAIAATLMVLTVLTVGPARRSAAASQKPADTRALRDNGSASGGGTAKRELADLSRQRAAGRRLA